MLEALEYVHTSPLNVFPANALTILLPMGAWYTLHRELDFGEFEGDVEEFIERKLFFLGSFALWLDSRFLSCGTE